MRTLILLALLAAGPVIGAPPAPNHLLLAEGDYAVPLAVVAGGEFTPLHLRTDGNRDPERIALAGRRLYGYRNGNLVGRFKVDAVLPPEDEYGDNERVMLSPQDGAGAVLFTTRPLAQRARPATAAPSAAMQATARRLVATLLSRPGLPERLRMQALPAESVYTIAVAHKGEPLLVVALDNAFGDGTNSLGLLLVAERRGENYAPVLQRVRWGGGEGRAGWTLVDHADLDGDGVDELVLKAWGWESVTVALLTRARGKWASVPAFSLPEDGS